MGNLGWNTLDSKVVCSSPGFHFQENPSKSYEMIYTHIYNFIWTNLKSFGMLLPSNCVVYVVYLFKISFLNFQKWSSEANFVSDQNLDDAVNVIVLPFLIDSFIMLFRCHNQGFLMIFTTLGSTNFWSFLQCLLGSCDALLILSNVFQKDKLVLSDPNF